MYNKYLFKISLLINLYFNKKQYVIILKNEPHRPRKLERAIDKINLDNIRYILYIAPKNRAINERLIAENDAKLVRIKSFNELMKYYLFAKLKT